jgi:hypothetical protein
MKAIIAGGRDYHLTLLDNTWLTDLWHDLKFDEVVHGDAQGADREAAAWAVRHGVKVTPVPADWVTNGRGAGPMRNAKMIACVGSDGVLITFPGGRGTADIIRRAKKAGIRHVERVQG